MAKVNLFVTGTGQTFISASQHLIGSRVATYDAVFSQCLAAMPGLASAVSRCAGRFQVGSGSQYLWHVCQHCNWACLSEFFLHMPCEDHHLGCLHTYTVVLSEEWSGSHMSVSLIITEA